MDNGDNGSQQPTQDEADRQAALTAAISDAAYIAWSSSREGDQDTTKALFDRAYLGHYGSVDAYAEELVDRYDLDAKLDAAIAEPFRRHLDIDITALARWLVANGTLYALPAIPVGVWVFNGEIA